MVKIVSGHCHSILKLAVSQEETDGIKDFLHHDTNSGKLEVTLIIFGWAWSFKSLGSKICFLRMN